MRWWEAFALAVIIILLPPQQPLILPNSTGPRQVLLSPGYMLATPIKVQLNGTYIEINISSSNVINAYVVSSSNYSQYFLPAYTASLFRWSGTSILAQVGPLTHGYYYLVIYNPGTQNAFVILNVWTEPVNIYKIRSSQPAPIGIADYGVANYSGSLSPYVESFNKIIGYASIKALNATSNVYVLKGVTTSLQLNVMFVTNGSQENVYWLQDVALFNTNTHTVFFEDSIWNSDGIGAQISPSISGNGRSYGDYYAYIYGPEGYSLPLNLALLINSRSEGGTVQISFGYQVNGQRAVWYDNVSFQEPGLLNAYMEVNGYGYTPAGNFYDAELVFGGPANGGETYINKINASLKLEYLGQSGPFLPKQLYGFGSDTAETLYGAGTFVMNGTAYVLPGQPSFEPLYEATPPPFSATVSLPSVEVEYADLPLHIYSRTTGGLAPYTFIIIVNGTRVATLNTYTGVINETIYLNPLPAGTYNVTVISKDSAGSESFSTFQVHVVETLMTQLFNGPIGLITSIALAAVGLIIYLISNSLKRNNLYQWYLIT